MGDFLSNKNGKMRHIFDYLLLFEIYKAVMAVWSEESYFMEN